MISLTQHDRRVLWTAALFALLLAIAFTLVVPRETHAGDAAPPETVFRVCADPNNLPFTDARGQGFENKIAELLAADLHERVEYTWWRQTRSFFRNTLDAHRCDVVMGVPSRFPKALVTAPYYTSTYVFVTRRDRRLRIHSLDDQRLRTLRVGIHLISDDDDAPPAMALERRGIVKNVRWFEIFGDDYRQPHPPSQLLNAVARGDVDIAIVWGPLAGYFAAREPVPLELTPVEPQVDIPAVPFVYGISIGVRRDDAARRAALQASLVRNRAQIDQILAQYGVPRLDKGVPRS